MTLDLEESVCRIRKEKENQASVQVAASRKERKKEGEVRERKSERLCDSFNEPIMAFSTFAFRASGLFCEGCDEMEAQDDLQRRIHFRRFVAAHQEIQIRIVGKRSAIPHYRISFYCRSHLMHSLTAPTTKTAHCAYPIRSRNTHMNTVRNV